MLVPIPPPGGPVISLQQSDASTQTEDHVTTTSGGHTGCQAPESGGNRKEAVMTAKVSFDGTPQEVLAGSANGHETVWAAHF